MRKVLVAVSIILTLLSNATASTNWADLQRQAPDLDLQLIESASLSLHILSESSVTLQPKGTVVILPDYQQHAFSPRLLNTLRLHLPAAGWNVLVMPAPETSEQISPEQKLLQQKSQLAARWQLLNQQGNLQNPVIVIAQGETAALLNLLVAEALATRPAAIVNLGAYLTDQQQNNQLLKQVALTPLPLLDLITAVDHPHATATTQQRQLVARAQQNSLYRQRYLSEARQDQPMQQWLIKEILGWLQTNGF
ncbi:hypothetical protein GCM10010919_05460 [Alishewanella longhuensis]|uniref:DUF3530 family protein n=1 Tax=Alishewanella longhuensis TaxID=1091037 RepID=A0ABQ3KV96_9ALTE|nr:DUF3530 family protein [Alishewanella longhuensis]GHG61251.1 hypothetical protein GCM10010919_05460 [Alishewanella longhuensis]